MRTRLILFACLMNLLYAFSVRAQQTFSLNFVGSDTTQYFFSDTIRLNAVLTMSGAGIYQGTLKFGYAVPTGTAQPDTILPANNTLVIQNNQPIAYQIDIPVKMQSFGSGGGHTVIVWPILAPQPAGVVVDTLEFSVEVLGWMKNPQTEPVLSGVLYPNPADDHVLWIISGIPDQASAHLADAQGRILANSVASGGRWEFSLVDLPAGIYWIYHSSHDGIKMNKLVKR